MTMAGSLHPPRDPHPKLTPHFNEKSRISLVRCPQGRCVQDPVRAVDGPRPAEADRKRQDAVHGFTTSTPTSAKSSTFLVANAAP